MILATLGLLFGLLPIGDDLFKVEKQGDVALVSANRGAVTAAEALQQLCVAMSPQWKLRDTKEIRAELEKISLDLAFDGQPARVVAQLIAVSAGLDVVFDDQTVQGSERVTMHVVAAPSPSSESGRHRLKNRAIYWYRQFLSEGLAFDPLVEEEGMKAWMHLGRLYLEAGQLEDAIEAFDKVYQSDPSHPFVPIAMLRIAEANFELGTPESLMEAKRWAGSLAERNPRLRPTGEATVLLGRILLQQEQYDECVQTLEARGISLTGSLEFVNLYLIVVEAQWHRSRVDKALATLDLIFESSQFQSLSRQQWLDYHYWRGLVTQENAMAMPPSDRQQQLLMQSMEALELFLGIGVEDTRRPQAFVVLGDSYLALGKFLQARAAAVDAMNFESGMTRYWLQRARILSAKTALALGDQELAFVNLETEVRRNPDSKPELILFLADAFIGVKSYQRAISTAQLLTHQKSSWGDQARFKQVFAMWEQAKNSEARKGFPEKAIRIAKNIVDEKLQRQIAEIIGHAYETTGEVEKAADAYRGVLR